METPKYITYDGLRFCRDDKTGYYLNSTIRKRLHRYVWEREVGTIPKGCQIHHIDGNKANNDISNLAIMTATGHQRLHGQEQARKEASRANVKKATAAAPAWHRSEAGKKWHAEHAKGRKQPRTDKTCEYCGTLFKGTKTQRFCSNKCKAAWRRRSGKDDIQRTCELCGKIFATSKYEKVKFCSLECTHRAHIGWNERRQSKA